MWYQSNVARAGSAYKFLPPEVIRNLKLNSGEFGGIGIEITVQNDILTVIYTYEDTPLGGRVLVEIESLR